MSIYTIRSGASQMPEDSFLKFFTDITRKGGVWNKSSDFLVSQPAGGGLNVDVSTGTALLKKSGNTYPVYSNATETVSISANSSGNDRIDAIVLYVDLLATPATDGSDVAKIKVVEGTPAASPTAPADSDIEADSDIGSTNPYLRLANVTVADGATGISDSDIEQTTTQANVRTITEVVSLDYASSITPDFEDGSQQAITLTGDITVNTPTNMKNGDVLLLDFTQDATGSRTVTWNITNGKEVGGEVQLSGTANTTDTIGIRKVGSDYYIYIVGSEIA